MARILVAGLNPAWQKVGVLSQFARGEVNRFQTVRECASGKGINAARVLRKLGHDVSVLQFIGGEAGNRILKELDELEIDSLHVKVPQNTRTCTSVIEQEPPTVSELIEPFGLDEGAGDKLLQLAGSGISGLDAVLFCGSLPDGLPAYFYDELWKALSPSWTLVDAAGGFSPELLEQIQILKINHLEFAKLKFQLPRKLSSLKHICITQGGKPAELWSQPRGRAWERSHTFEVPTVQVLNPIGAGDTVTAGLTHHLLGGSNFMEAFRQSLVLGSASCLSLLPGHYREADRIRILEAS